MLYLQLVGALLTVFVIKWILFIVFIKIIVWSGKRKAKETMEKLGGKKNDRNDGGKENVDM